MQPGGTTRKRATIAGAAAIATGAAAATIGLFATPALADSADISYACTGMIDSSQQPVSFDATATVAGAVTGTPKVGDPITLDGFQVTVVTGPTGLTLLNADHVSGTFSTFPVTATAGDGSGAGSADPSGSMSIDADVAPDDTLTFTTPAGAIALAGFTTNVAGEVDFAAGAFSANLTLTAAGNQVDTASVTCTGSGVFAKGTVAPKSTPSPKPTTGTGGKNPPKSPPPNSPAPATTAPAQNTGTGTTPVTNTASGRPALASTGTAYAVPMSAGGTALVLLGAGMLLAARRRHDPVLDGPAGLDGSDGPSSAEADTEV